MEGEGGRGERNRERESQRQRHTEKQKEEEEEEQRARGGQRSRRMKAEMNLCHRVMGQWLAHLPGSLAEHGIPGTHSVSDAGPENLCLTCSPLDTVSAASGFRLLWPPARVPASGLGFDIDLLSGTETSYAPAVWGLGSPPGPALSLLLVAAPAPAQEGSTVAGTALQWRTSGAVCGSTGLRLPAVRHFRGGGTFLSDWNWQAASCSCITCIVHCLLSQ